MTTLHVVSHTHWDREWYRTFQQFRFRLVRAMDQLLDLLEQDPGYAFFTLDGQTIVLDDYLAIRPDNEPRIRKLVRDGRLLVGPWYVLPDEFLEGPEAMVRNLQFGRQGCRRFTDHPQPMERIGYIPDPFGHIGQLPQLAAGFGMDALCFWRGVGEAPTEFRWAAPDGTERLVLHLRHSYSNGAWLAAGEEGFVRDLAAERDALSPHAVTSHLLVMQGTDHMECRPDLPARLSAAEAALGTRVVHSTLPAYLEAVQTELSSAGGPGSLELRHGEMRSPEKSHLLPAVLSARIWIKQRNAHCEALLTRWAEPVSALAEQVAGGTGQRGFLRQAWDWLLQNHPHDSICGCSVDQVHREMETRFAWSEQLAELVTQAGLDRLAGQVDTQGDSPSTTPILVFNPSPFARSDRVRVHLPATPPGDWSLVDTTGQPVPHRVVDEAAPEHYNEIMPRQAFEAWLANVAAGQGPDIGRVSVQGIRTRIEDGIAHFEAVIRQAQPGEATALSDTDMERLAAILADETVALFHVHVVEDAGLEVEFVARDVPSLGYARFSILESHAPARPPESVTQDPGFRIENEFFAVEPNPADGTLAVTDKATGLALTGANRFVDGGDRGDEYTWCPPQHDLVVDRPAAAPAIRRLDDGLGSSLEISLLYRLPSGLASGDRSTRSRDLVDVPITTRITLSPGVRRVEFETTVVNRASDHRLRVHFPTPISTEVSSAEGHFDVVERPIALPSGTEGWSEQPVGTQPQLTFADLADGRQGVMVVNRGLPEFEALPATGGEPGAALALTLLRCVGWLSRGDLSNRSGHAGPALPTPEAQCLGEHTYHYALVPHAGNYLTAYREAHAFNAALRAVPTGRHDGLLPAAGASFLEMSPSAVVLSAVKPPQQGDGLVIRVYNSAPVPVQARLKLWHTFREVGLTALDEETLSRPLPLEAGTVTVPLRAKEIATIRCR